MRSALSETAGNFPYEFADFIWFGHTRPAAETLWKIREAVTAQKNERDAAFGQFVCKRIDHFAGQIDIENSDVEVRPACRFARPFEVAYAVCNRTAGRAQFVLQQESQQVLVLDDQAT